MLSFLKHVNLFILGVNRRTTRFSI